jgi:fatty acid amide hydrolase
MRSFLETYWHAITTTVPPQIVLYTIILVLVVRSVITSMAAKRKATHFRDLALKKRRERDDMIKDVESIQVKLSPEVEDVALNGDVTGLLQLLNAGKVSSQDLVKFYYKRACTIGKDLELIAESNYDNAIELAIKYDEIRKKTPEKERSNLGLLYGIPISVKDSFDQKGLDSTMGASSNLYKPYADDGLVLKALKAQGAIPFIRSNVPQLLSINESVNNIWGRAKNPWDTTRAVGGSSGGESGLLAANCSPLGIGSDGLGSCRIPNSYCGVYGFRPTTGRHVMKGHSTLNTMSRGKFAFVKAAMGPIGRSIDDMVLLMKSLFKNGDFKAEEPIMPNLPYQDNYKLPQRKLNIGYQLNEDFFGVSEPCKRAVREAAEVLKKQGHNVYEIQIPNFEKLVFYIFAIMTSDGGNRGTEETLQGEDVIKEMSLSRKLGALPRWSRKMLSNILSLVGEKRASKLMVSTGGLAAHEFFTTVHNMGVDSSAFFDWWKDSKLDAIISPVTALTAVKHGTANDLLLACSYCFLGNMLNMPTGTIPVTIVKKEEEGVYECIHKDKFAKAAKACTLDSAGLPVSVQVMTLPWEDEKCVEILRLIDNEIQFRKNFKCPIRLA